MSERMRSNLTLLIAALGALGTGLAVTMQVGSLKGEFVQRMKGFEEWRGEKLRHDEKQDEAINDLRRDQAVISSKLHGISTKIGQVPGKVASRLEHDEEQQ